MEVKVLVLGYMMAVMPYMIIFYSFKINIYITSNILIRLLYCHYCHYQHHYYYHYYYHYHYHYYY